MNQLICNAIKTCNCISFNYDGGVRTVEPYCHGVLKNGNEALRAYQIEGYSKSKNPTGWKLFLISKILNLTINNEKFQIIRPEYNPNDSAMIRIYCRI